MKEYKTIHYKLAANQRQGIKEQKAYEEMKTILAKAGIYLDVTGNRLSIGIHDLEYDRFTTRNAGRRKRVVLKHDQNHNLEVYKYSDVYPLLFQKKDIEIMELLHMSSSTYYRRKKKMMTSDYVKNIDKSQVLNFEYMKNYQPGKNQSF